ncbi:tetratricopeptide repeat protein [Methylobacter sp. G7]|uniref:tetratricopeptide repeat protein n=1 Tax=Methylobacter sp. G7 TaxID=3230117 RepID=UPI003D80A338
MAKTFASFKDVGNQLENHHYADAAELYRAALKMQPGNAAASMGLAMVHNRTGQPEAALKLLQGVWKAIANSKNKGVKIK